MSPRTLIHLLSTVALFAVLAAPASATAIINVVNADGPGEGFNDPTPAAPVGGNPGTTIGEQRFLCLQRAADIWAAALTSSVPIVIHTQFNPSPYCTPTAGGLGGGWATYSFADPTQFEIPDHWYSSALADQQAGYDLNPGVSDLYVWFVSNIGQASCLPNQSWYYGFDLHDGQPGGSFVSYSVVSVALHQIAHGLGFTSMTNLATGEYMGGPDFPLPGVCDKFLYDETTGLHWDQMTPAERVASARNTDNLTWDVPDRVNPDGSAHRGALNFMAPKLMGHAPEVLVPFGSGSMLGGIANFGAPITEAGVSGEAVMVVDNAAPTGDGCETIANTAELVGKIAVVDFYVGAGFLGSCRPMIQAKNAQDAGAIGIIVVSGDSSPQVGTSMAGFDPTITVPTTRISQADGTSLKAAIAGGPTSVTIRLSPTVIPGLSPGGRIRMYAPATTNNWSIAHFDGGAARDLQMDGGPFSWAVIGGETALDLTPYYLEDLGWMIPRTTSVPTAGPASRVTLASHPNPARTSASVHFELPIAETLQLTLYDVSGRQVRVLAKGAYIAGPHDVAWDGLDTAGRRAAPGVYMARLKGPRTQATHHLVLVN